MRRPKIAVCEICVKWNFATSAVHIHPDIQVEISRPAPLHTGCQATARVVACALSATPGEPCARGGLEGRLARLISFDIDGTLETGNPPGVITMRMVRDVMACGYIVGSCSDRPISSQKRMWAEHGINVGFTSLKHRLDGVKERFAADEYYHVGDTEVDRHYAGLSGFRFIPVQEVSTGDGWLPHLAREAYGGLQ